MQFWLINVFEFEFGSFMSQDVLSISTVLLQQRWRGNSPMHVWPRFSQIVIEIYPRKYKYKQLKACGSLKKTLHCQTSLTTYVLRWCDCFRVFNDSTSTCCDLLLFWSNNANIWASKLRSIGSDNGLPPGRRQAIIWTNAGILSIGPLGTNIEILIEIHTFSFKKMHMKMSSGKWRLFCLSLGVIYKHPFSFHYVRLYICK